MAKKSIPDNVKAEVIEITERFNQKHLKKYGCKYVPRFKGRFLYLDRDEGFGKPGAVCRLEYTGDTSNWGFAIFKFSTEKYDPDEWMFPGTECLDGTVEGALMAGIKAYPI